MPDREVKLGFMTYTDEDGLQGRFGLRGETVHVHPDDVKRFDELNVDMGPPYVPERVPQEVIVPDIAAAEEPADDSARRAGKARKGQ